MASCDIIIPYYQLKEGILARAVASVFSQTSRDWRLIIVDDGSPCPAERDLATLSEAQRGRIVLVKKPNGGVSSARNAGLDMVSPDARIVAFLDSDDVWDPGHLSRAERALALPDIGLYWAGVSGEAFSEDYVPVSHALPASQARTIDTLQDAYCVKDLYGVLCGPWWRHMHLSSTVISAGLARRLRFEERLKLSEDFAFLLACAGAGLQAVASDAPGVTRGRGANLWHGLAFDDERVAVEKFIMMRLYKKFRRSPRLSAGMRQIIDARIEGRRQQFFWNQVRRIRSGKRPTLAIWLQWFMHDPVLVRTVLGRVCGRVPDPGRYVIPLETA